MFLAKPPQSLFKTGIVNINNPRFDPSIMKWTPAVVVWSSGNGLCVNVSDVICDFYTAMDWCKQTNDILKKEGKL